MQRQLKAFAVLTALLAIGASARGEDASDNRSRYSMSPVEGGQLRLDKETGAVALCARKGETWTCEPVEDKAKTIEEKLKQLEDENKELKNHIANLDAMLDKDLKGGDKGPPAGSMQIPSEEDVDKALDYVERMFKKFRDRLQKLEKPAPDAAPAPEGEGGGRL